MMVAFQIGDIVSVTGKYAADWKDCDLTIVGIFREVRDGEITDKISYHTWVKGEGVTDGWTHDELILKKRAIS